MFACSQHAAAPTLQRAGPDGAEQSLPMETAGPAALAACRRGLAPAGHHPRSRLGWDLAGWQLHATPAVRAISVALCIAFVAKAWTLSAPIHGLTRSRSSLSKVSLSLKEPLRTPVPSQPVSLPTPALVWSGPARALPCVCLPGCSGWLLPGRASGPRLPSSHRHSSHRAPHWRDRRCENACLSENYDPMKHPLREVMACGGAGPERPSCGGTKHSCAWGSVLELEQGPGAGMQRRVLQEGSQRRAPEQDTAGPGPRAPQEGPPDGLQKRGGWWEVLRLPRTLAPVRSAIYSEVYFLYWLQSPAWEEPPSAWWQRRPHSSASERLPHGHRPPQHDGTGPPPLPRGHRGTTSPFAALEGSGACQPPTLGGGWGARVAQGGPLGSFILFSVFLKCTPCLPC